jgi:YD repeat-containing protein
VVSASEIEYDNFSTTANPRFTKAWDNTKGSYSSPLNSGNAVITEAQYDGYGNVTQTWDAKGNRTEITYGTISWPGGSVSGLYPTLTVAAANNTTIKQPTRRMESKCVRDTKRQTPAILTN